jgi:hypothetical protein
LVTSWVKLSGVTIIDKQRTFAAAGAWCRAAPDRAMETTERAARIAAGFDDQFNAL